MFTFLCQLPCQSVYKQITVVVVVVDVVVVFIFTSCLKPRIAFNNRETFHCTIHRHRPFHGIFTILLPYFTFVVCQFSYFMLFFLHNILFLCFSFLSVSTYWNKIETRAYSFHNGIGSCCVKTVQFFSSFFVLKIRSTPAKCSNWTWRKQIA